MARISSRMGIRRHPFRLGCLTHAVECSTIHQNFANSIHTRRHGVTAVRASQLSLYKLLMGDSKLSNLIENF